MKIVIEEVISQEFEVPDGTDFEKAREMYKAGELIVDNGNLVCASVLIKEGESWQEM